MLQPISRYSAQTEYRNNEPFVVAVRAKTTTTSFITHTTREGETMDILATKYLKSPLFYWRIADINPQIPFPDQIPAGTKVRIPQ